MSKHEQYDLTEIGKRLRNLRAHQRKTQADMAEELGISLSHYSKLEIGVGGMSRGLALALCRQYNLSEDWLLYGIGEPPEICDIKVTSRAARVRAHAHSVSTILSDSILEKIITIVLEENVRPLAEQIASTMNIPITRAIAMLVKEQLRDEKPRDDKKASNANI